MKIIDLLNKIANGEEVPNKINFCMRNFEYKKDINDYLCIEEDFNETGNYCLGTSICKWIFPSMLKDEIEIIEEDKKIEPIKYEINKVIGLSDCIDKINEIISYLNKGDK